MEVSGCWGPLSRGGAALGWGGTTTLLGSKTGAVRAWHGLRVRSAAFIDMIPVGCPPRGSIPQDSGAGCKAQG